LFVSAVLPSRVLLTNKQAALASAQTCIASKECDIKGYYFDNIQPEEKELTKAKAFNEKVLAGSYVAGDSMAQKKIDQMAIQSDLYVRQIASFDDKKFQSLLDTQVNYAAMIFADTEETPQILVMGKEDAVKTTYEKLQGEPLT